MSICRSIGNGIGGAIGKWGAGLGSALGLGAAVDLGVRGYTGYGLLETLNVPYIECPDGSFATAMEWYGSGLKCPKKPESVKPQMQPTGQTPQQGAIGYDDIIAALGGSTITYFAYHVFGFNTAGSMLGNSPLWEPRPGHFDIVSNTQDKVGNNLPSGTLRESYGSWPWAYIPAYTRGGDILDSSFSSTWNGISGGSFWFVNERCPTTHLTKPTLAYMRANGFFNNPRAPWTFLGIQAQIPSNYEKAPPAASIPPPPAFAPNPPSPPEECEMSCPCLSPQEIEKIVKRAIGLAPFSPEKIVREMGAKMYAAPGPSVVPIAPTTLVEAIAALTATIYMRAGYGRYPVVMPNSLINDDSGADAVPTAAIENFAEWFEWFVKQQDAIQGEWPVELQIVEGAKKQPLKFENISEAFSEMTGLLIQTATDADAAVNAACTSAVAATKATNAAIVAQKNVECLIRFFGVRTGFKSIFVQSPITPADPDDRNFNLRKFLTPSGQNLAYLSDEDPFDFQAVLDRILRNTEINRASVARNIDKDGLPGDFARNQRKYDASESRREAEKELEKLEQTIQSKNPEFKIKIKIDTPASDLIAGDNFVIKRPKKDE